MIVRLLFFAFLLIPLVGCMTVAATSGRVAIESEGGNANARHDVSFFTDRDRVLIREYYRKKPLSPSMIQRGKLPAGFAKRNTLPSGHPGERLPQELESKLSSLPSNYVRTRTGQDVVVMDAKTRVVFDIFYAVGK